jgi:hypothetical protein
MESQRPVSGSILSRLRRFRERVEDLREAERSELEAVLSELPEPWARRRAVAVLIEAGVLASASAALDLIEDLERSMDRQWCLSALARRGDLEGDDLERALAMLSSPAARRRVASLAEASVV